MLSLISCLSNSHAQYMHRFGGRVGFVVVSPALQNFCTGLQSANRGVKLTLKTLGTVTVSWVFSPLAEMTVTVGLDMVSIWALSCG